MATLIHNVTELQNMNLDLAGDYELANDIDASGVNFIPIGSISSHFTGTLDGQGYKVTGLTITISGGGGTKAGAFIDTNEGLIENIGLEDCQISITSTDTNAYAAGLVRVNWDNGVIENCWVTGNISANGSPSSTMYTSAGTIVEVNYGTINQCYSEATVNVTSTKHSFGGGFVVENSGNITKCFAIGNIIVTAGGTKIAHAGGFVAENENYYGGLIKDCYSLGNATALGGTSQYAGGFVEWNGSGNITNCYSIGIPTGVSGTGGFCRLNSDTITGCFWDTETSGQVTSDGGTGKTTIQMKVKSTFSGWNIIASGSDLNNGYPFLNWQLAGATSPIWKIYASYATSPRETKPIEDKITLELIRNVEMSAHGRAYVDKEGKFHYDSRFGRIPL